MSIIKRTDFEDFFIRTYFGSNSNDYIELSIHRSYLDFNRTLHGMSKIQFKDRILLEAKEYIKVRLTNIRYQTITQKEYNFWHKESCIGLIQIYNQYDYKSFYIGQGQKWINMTMKYLFALGEERVKGYKAVYPLCHVPIDNIILNKLKEYNFPNYFSVSWSRINDYDQEYLLFQKRIREMFPEYTPLEFEFLLWLEKLT